MEMLAETNTPGPNEWPKDPESRGWFYETWGDLLSPSSEAREKYQKAIYMFSIFASWSTSGGEGTARMMEVYRVEKKLEALNADR